MPRTDLTITEITRAGVAQPSQQNSDNVNGNRIPWNDNRVFLFLDSTTTTVFTFSFPNLVDGQTVAAKTVSVSSGTSKLVGPFPEGIYEQSDGSIYVDTDNANGRIRAYHI